MKYNVGDRIKFQYKIDIFKGTIIKKFQDTYLVYIDEIKNDMEIFESWILEVLNK